MTGIIVHDNTSLYMGIHEVDLSLGTNITVYARYIKWVYS